MMSLISLNIHIILYSEFISQSQFMIIQKVGLKVRLARLVVSFHLKLFTRYVDDILASAEEANRFLEYLTVFTPVKWTVRF